jgi:hypothetical protein
MEWPHQTSDARHTTRHYSNADPPGLLHNFYIHYFSQYCPSILALSFTSAALCLQLSVFVFVLLCILWSFPRPALPAPLSLHLGPFCFASPQLSNLLSPSCCTAAIAAAVASRYCLSLFHLSTLCYAVAEPSPSWILGGIIAPHPTLFDLPSLSSPCIHSPAFSEKSILPYMGGKGLIIDIPFVAT